MIIRQSDLKLYMGCALRYRFTHIDRLAREQTCALTFGTIVHDAVLYLETSRDLDGALDRFTTHWGDPASLDPELTITSWLPRRNWRGYHDEGTRLLRDWWGIVQWDPDVVLAREHRFEVPIAGHILQGTADKVVLRYDAPTDADVVLIVDYKTSANHNMPTLGDLSQDLQFTAYCYATTKAEFWAQIPNGERHYRNAKHHRRMGEWVQLRGPQRKTAGERNQRHYNRLAYAVEAIAASVAMGVFVPTISGATCVHCEFRDPCGVSATLAHPNGIPTPV